MFPSLDSANTLTPSWNRRGTPFPAIHSHLHSAPLQPLEGKTRGKLGRSSRSRARDHTEIPRPIRESRDVEVRVIQQIVKFAAQIELYAFGQGKGFFQSDVRGHERRSSQDRSR